MDDIEPDMRIEKIPDVIAIRPSTYIVILPLMSGAPP